MAIVIGKKVYTEEEIIEYLIKNLESVYLSKKKRKKSLNEVEEKILKFIKKIENSKVVKLIGKPEIFERVKRLIQSRIEAKKFKKGERKRRRKEEIDKLKKELGGGSIIRYDFIRLLIISRLLVHKLLGEKELSLSKITKEVNEELGAKEWILYKEKDIKRYLDEMVEEGLIKMVEKDGKIFYCLPEISSSYIQKIWKRYVLSKKRPDVKEEMEYIFYELIIFPIKLYNSKKQEECVVKKYSINIQYFIEGMESSQTSYVPCRLIVFDPSLCKRCNRCEVPRYYKAVSDWQKMNEKKTLENMADFYIERIAQTVSKEMYQFYKEKGYLTPYLIEIGNLLYLSRKLKKSRKISLCLKIYLKAFYKFILEICRSKIKPKVIRVGVRFVRLDHSGSNLTSNNS